MAKKFGKFLVISSILAGAAAGSYLFMKKEGIIDESASPAKSLADKVSADAEKLTRERTYLDLGEVGNVAAPEEGSAQAEDISDKAEEIKDKVDEAKDIATDKAEEAKDIVTDKVDEAKDIVADKAEEAKDIVTDKAEEAKDIVADKVDEAKDIVADKADEDDEEGSSFEFGINATKIDTAERKTIGSTISESFFNDEE